MSISDYNKQQEFAKAQAMAQLKSRVIKGAATGTGIAAGAAGAEVAMAGAASAAEATVAVVETIAWAPVLLTVAAVGAGCFGLYKIYEAVTE